MTMDTTSVTSGNLWIFDCFANNLEKLTISLTNYHKRKKTPVCNFWIPDNFDKSNIISI